MLAWGDDECYNMVQSYLEQCPETLDKLSGKRRGPWSLAKYEERVAAATGLVRDKVGEMMWEKVVCGVGADDEGRSTQRGRCDCTVEAVGEPCQEEGSVCHVRQPWARRQVADLGSHRGHRHVPEPVHA